MIEKTLILIKNNYDPLYCIGSHLIFQIGETSLIDDILVVRTFTQGSLSFELLNQCLGPLA
jgi:hypothetical protein